MGCEHKVAFFKILFKTKKTQLNGKILEFRISVQPQRILTNRLASIPGIE